MDMEKLIGELKEKDVLKSDKIEEAMRNVKREDFVREKHRKHAYGNLPLPIGENQTISQPLVVVKMTEWLDPKEGDKILEIGGGSGWQAGLIGYMIGKSGTVYTVERYHKLAEFARANLKRSNLKNVKVVEGDGSTGYSEEAPYDGIIVTAASPKMTGEWKDQLKEGGKIVVPIGKDTQTMIYGKKDNDKIERVKAERGYRFVPLKGERGF